MSLSTARAWNQIVWKILSYPCCSLKLWNTGHAEVMDFAVLTWTKWLAWFLIFPRAHPTSLEEKFFLQLGVASLWALCVSPSYGSYESVSKCMFMCGRGGVSWPPESQDQHTWYPTFSMTVWELEGYQLVSCARKPQLMCSNLGNMISPGPFALIGTVVAATQASPCGHPLYQ